MRFDPPHRAQEVHMGSPADRQRRESGAAARAPVERRHPPEALMRLVNPVMRRLVGRGRAADQVLVLHYTGRRTGKRYDVPAGYHLIAGVVTVLTSSAWRHNFRGGRDIEVTYRGVRRRAHAVLEDEPIAVASTLSDLIAEFGVQPAQRRLGIKINVDRAPTLEEVTDAVRRSGLSMVRVRLTDS
jgi:hypothetical protein